jgi:1-acyl-sn-glycerol-3-phosphate acyltransferase
MANADNVSPSPEDPLLADASSEDTSPLDRMIRWGLLTGFNLSSKLSVRLHVSGAQNIENKPGQFLVLNHKDDFDSIIILPVLRRLSKGKGPIGRLGVVAAEQIFERGFLTHQLLDHPWLSRMVCRIRVGRIVETLGWRPIAQGRTRFLASHLEDLLRHEGDLTLSQVFGDLFNTFFPGAKPNAPIQSVLNASFRKALYSPCDFSVFTAPVAQALKARHRIRIDAQLSTFADMLTRGNAVMIAPEGLTGCSGRIQSIKSGLSQIIDKSRRDVSITPIYPTYDYMSTGRSDAFMTFGPPLRNVNNWPRERLDHEVSRALTALITLTMGHLASYRVRRLAEEGHTHIDEQRLKGMVREHLESFRNYSLHSDPALHDTKRFEKRWKRLIDYCTAKHLLRKDATTLRFDPKNVLDDTVPTLGRASPWSYHDNEFQSLIEHLESRQEPIAQTP